MSNSFPHPTIDDIRAAHKRIKRQVHQTPVLQSRLLNELTGAELFFKCENFQSVGAFKFRGASNAILAAPDAALQRGVATHSSGNHAAALALAAKMRGIPAYIVMNETAPTPKKNAVEAYGGIITFCPPTQDERKRHLEEVVDRTGAMFIHPFDNFDVVCGQGTTGLELSLQAPGLDIVMPPVGGGGLLSGTATAVKNLMPRTRVFAAEPELARDAFLSFRSGTLHGAFPPQTIADGLLTSLSPFTFSIIRTHVDDILTVSETHIKQAMRLIWERMKIIVEPSAAVPLGAVLQHPAGFRNKKTGIVLSGGNLDFSKIAFLT